MNVRSTSTMYEEKVQGRWGRVATRCAAIAEHVEVSRREEDIIMHKDYGWIDPHSELQQRLIATHLLSSVALNTYMLVIPRPRRSWICSV